MVLLLLSQMMTLSGQTLKKLINVLLFFMNVSYQSQGEPDPDEMETFFENLDLPKLSAESSLSIDNEINSK